MAVMTDTQRQELWAEYMRESVAGENFSLTKPDLRAAVNAIDQWISDNAAALNSAIPLPARTALSTVQKARLFNYIVRQRYVVGA